ncbi:MAG: hypothetical protein ACJ74J_10040 [Blastocatellia bacterium]
MADIINALLLLAAVIGIFLTYHQTQQTYKTQKATFFKDLYSMMFSDSDIRRAYQQIEYDEFVYDENFHGSSNEHLVDRLLSFADLVCYLFDQKMLTEHEMNFFKYEFIRIYTNENVQNYLKFLKRFYRDNKTGTQPFSSYVLYCKTILRKPENHLPKRV